MLQEKKQDMPPQLVADPPRPKFRILADEFGNPSRLITAEQGATLLEYLEPPNRLEWRVVYNNYSEYGTSIRQLQKYVLLRGPTIVVVRDKGGAVFGMYAAESWQIKNDYYCDGRCFLFRIGPADGRGGMVERIEYSGRDKNFMYFNLGCETLPNGIGMGGMCRECGENGWFSLFLSDDLKRGETHKTLTFDRYEGDLASSDGKFDIDLLEVIRVSKPSVEEEDRITKHMTKKKSALLLNPDAKAALEALGKTNWTARAGVKGEELGGGSDDDQTVQI